MIKEQISTYGLTDEDFRFLTNAIWDSSITIHKESTPVHSIMKRKLFALILNLESCSPNEREFIKGYYEELIWFPETLIFIGECRPDWKVTGQIIYSSNLTNESNLRKILEAAYSKTRNTENFREGIIRAFQIAREIRHRPGVTSASLSQDLSLSEDLVNWYINLLQSSFELIEYNQDIEGWNYFDDREPGSLDQTIRSELSNQAMNNSLDGWIKYEDNSIQMVENIKSEGSKDSKSI